MSSRPAVQDPHDLERFISAQAPLIDTVQAELRAGQKRTHWMWFIFPQLRTLGRSPTALHYGIASRAEAEAYRNHPILGPRLITCTTRVNAVQHRSVHQIFGSPDDLKFHSCMTLFAYLPGTEPVFHAALAKYFAGIPDQRTLDLLA